MILIPFIYPKGFANFFGWYKSLFTIWLFVSLAAVMFFIAWIGVRRSLRLKRCLYWMIGYFIVFLAITLGVQHGIHDGLQKLFAAPIVCLFSMVALKEYPETYISCLANIFLVEFILGLTIFSPFVMPGYFSEASHMLFLGHVQMASQFGIISTMLAYFLMRSTREKVRPLLLIICAFATMAISGTVASYVAIGILGLGILFSQFKEIRMLFSHPLAMFWFYIICNIILFAATWMLNGDYNLFGVRVDLNGRMFIWQAAAELMQDHWAFGYGAYGATLYVFWSQAVGMNYGHNQIIQCLLDGGVCLTALFLIMTFSFVHAMKQTRKKELYFPCICLLAFLLVMLIESTTEYLYVYVFFILIAYLPEITARYIKGPLKVRIK